MATQNNEQIIRKVYQAFENRRLDEVFSFFDDNAEAKLLSMPHRQMKGVKEIRDYMESWLKAFPDQKAEILDVIVSGDKVVLETVNRATHGGPVELPDGIVQATHRKIEVPSADIYKFSNGKIVSWHCYWEGGVMLDQLGLLQHPGRAAA